MKHDARLRIVRYANHHGVKPAMREFGVARNTVRKWLRRWRDDNYSKRSLADRSRAPHSCPHKTPPRIEKQIVKAREKAPCFGARRLKRIYALPAGQTAIARVLRQNGLTKRRKKKYEKKRDMRALKASYRRFEKNQVDVKYLNDIPYYVEQLWGDTTLPRFEYTWRDPKTGGLFLGFANELSETHACVFVAAVGAHLKQTGYDLADARSIQTDNGSEFSGLERRLDRDRGFTWTVEKRLGARHIFIPPGKKNYQADVETVHHWIEVEFFDLERFGGRAEFFAKASAWNLWWNVARENSYKGDKTPEQILLEADPDRDPSVWLLPALDLDRLLAARTNAMAHRAATGGHHLPALPGMPETLRGLARPHPGEQGAWTRHNTSPRPVRGARMARWDSIRTGGLIHSRDIGGSPSQSMR